jgi:hypothetical protein
MRAEYQKAMEYWQQALAIGEQMADRESQIEPLYQLGHLYTLLGESVEAEKRLTASESIANQLNASGSLGSIYELLARLSLQSGDMAKAKSYSERSLELLKRSGDQSKLARGWITRGDIAAALGDDALLKQCMNQANKLANETGESHLKIMCFLSMLNHALDRPLDESKSKELASTLKDVLELSASFPELKWQANWAKGRFLKSKGRWKAATDAYSQSISILKQISRRLSEPHQSCYLKGKIQQRFRKEVIELKKTYK